MIYTLFDQNGRAIAIKGSSSFYESDDPLLIEGDYGGYYIEDSVLYEKTEFIIPAMVDNKIDFGVRLEGDMLVVNSIQYYPVGPTIVEFSESGEYEILISFVKYFEKTETITCE